jgi:hypothetical protein
MTEKKFVIKEITSIKFIDSTTGEEIKDMRDEELIQKEFNPNIPILDLVKSVSPSYDICNHPIIRKYGYDTFGSICEAWYWRDNLSEASEEELWKIYALIQASWLANYEYWYHKEECEFRKYKREHENK